MKIVSVVSLLLLLLFSTAGFCMDEKIEQKIAELLQYEMSEPVLADLVATHDSRISRYAVDCDDASIISQLFSNRFASGMAKISDVEAMQTARRWKFNHLMPEVIGHISKSQYSQLFDRMCLLKSLRGTICQVRDEELRVAILQNHPKKVHKALSFNANAARKLNDHGTALNLFLEVLERIGNQKDCYHELKHAQRIEKILVASLESYLFFLIRNGKPERIQRTLAVGINPEVTYQGNSALGLARQLVQQENTHRLQSRKAIVSLLEQAIAKRKSADATYLDTFIINQIQKKIQSIAQAHPCNRFQIGNTALHTTQQSQDSAPSAKNAHIPDTTHLKKHPQQKDVPDLLNKAAVHLKDGSDREDACIINAMHFLQEAIWYGACEIHGTRLYKFYWLMARVEEYVKKRSTLADDWAILQNELKRARAELALRKLIAKKESQSCVTSEEMVTIHADPMPLSDLMMRAKMSSEACKY